MSLKSFAIILAIFGSLVIVNGQTPDAQTPSPSNMKLRDLPFQAGIDQQFLIRELARDLGLNVLFDPESFRVSRKTFLDLKNVTAARALDYVLLQNGFYFEEVGPKTILIANRFRGNSIPYIGAEVTILTVQLSEYFGVDGGVLINTVRESSPAFKAGLKAGDVIVEVEGISTKGPLTVVQKIIAQNAGEITLTIVRDRKRLSMRLTPKTEISSVGKIVAAGQNSSQNSRNSGWLPRRQMKPSRT